jgi:tetratricopeptide (TPR) repeat protein
VDAQVAAFLARWRTLRPGREPLIALTADHGEGLGEHGEPTHGLFIYDSTIRVPLIVSGPGVRAGTVVKGAVRTIDIAPTLLDLAGLRPMRRVEGHSLRRAIVSGRADDEPAYAESLFGRLGFGWAPLHGWRDRGLMLIDAPRPEIYDTSNDPAQARNLAAGRGGDLARMRRALQAAVARAPEAKPSTPSPETSERLRSLGYVASGPVGSPSLRDPKDFAALAALVETAISLERANPAKAAADLRTALKDDPDNAVARRHLAMALVNARRFDAAAGELTILLAAGDDSLETLTLLGDSYRLSGRLAQALDTFTWAVSKDGNAPEGYNGQGKVLTGLGRTEDARRAFERALQAAPDDAEALEGLADLALARGDLAEAQRQLDALAQRDPDDSRVALKRGVVLVRLGELDGAIAIFRAVADREPANAEAAVDLGGALAKSGRAAEAVPYFERAITAGAGGPVVWNGLAMARLETGNQAGAVQALRQSLRARPDQPNIKDMLERLQRQ